MRRSFSPLLLGALALASCEPDAGTSTTSGGGQRKSEVGLLSNLPSSAISHEQISAQESVGKVPLPRNFAGDSDDNCPVHHAKMSLREVPIVFADGAPSPDAAARAAFPFAAEKIFSEGNPLLPSQPLTARIYQCPACIAAQHAAEAKRVPPPENPARRPAVGAITFRASPARE